VNGALAIFGPAAILMAFLLSHAICRLVMRQRFGLDPVSARSNHQIPTPRTGGLAILIALTAAVGVLFAGGLLSQTAALLLLFSGAAGALGLADDFFHLPALPKLALLTALSLGAAYLFGPIAALPLPGAGWVVLPEPVGLVLTVFWLVSIVNVVNFMDGLNGLIGSFAILLFSALSLIASELTLLLLVVEAAILGFLLCNIFRGRVFLGDGGSLALGFFAGAAPLAAEGGEGRAVWLLALIGLPLIADVALTLIRRARRGEPLTEAHREHFYQKLKAAGWSHQAVSGTLLLLGMAALVLALGGANDANIYWLTALAILVIWGLTFGAMFRLKPQP
jgi:UDP-N-acetylmuramyl pentapeptide phosphotransferase/UDP-N-acetylglucosamine-1-phosphate transferase